MANEPCGAQRVQGMPEGYGDPLYVTMAAGSSPSGGLTDEELRASPVPVIGPLTDTELRASPFWVGISGGSVGILGTVAVSGPLTDTQLRATPVPVSGTVTANVGTVPVIGTFWQATQPVSAASLPLPSGASTETTLSALNTKMPALGQATMANSSPVCLASNQSALAVIGTFWQTTQPISGTVTIIPPTLTKGTQGSTGLSVQNLKDAGRSSISMTAEFTFAQTAETLLTMTFSADGAATSTFSSRVVTSGKTFRIQQVIIEIEGLGSGTAPQRAYLRLRRNNAGATTASSPLQCVWSCALSTAIIKAGAVQAFDVPDGLEIVGDGTKTFGFTLETPDYVATTATGRAKISIIGYEY